MKQKLLLLLAVILSSISAMAYSFQVDGIYYNKSGSNATVTYNTSSYNSYSGVITIPESVTYSGTTYRVTSIGENAFRKCSSLISVTIPESVTSIGSYAFEYCSSLTSVTIPESITSIGGYAFRYCNGLTSVTIPESVTSISNYAFNNCSSLTSVTIPESVTSIGSSAFRGCSGLTSVTIPESVTSIGEYAFSGCKGLTSVTIPRPVTSINDYVFYGCSNLSSVTMPQSVTSIGSYAFAYCNNLSSVTIPGSVTSIGNFVFDNCISLKDVIIEDGVSTLAVGYNSSSKGLFADCPLETLYLGRTLTYDSSNSKGYSPFYGISSLISVSIGNSVTSIPSYAFMNCSGLTSVTIGSSVYFIETRAFSDCRSLTSVTILGTITSFASNAFGNCSCIFQLKSSVPGQYGYNNCMIFVPQNALADYREAWPEHANEIVGDESQNQVVFNVEACIDESDIIRKIAKLAESLGKTELETSLSITNLKLIGSINSYDVMALHNKLINLVELDLSEVDIVANSYQYYTGICTIDNIITNHFLGDFNKLITVKLPNSAVTIQQNAVGSGSPALKNLIIGNETTTVSPYAFRNNTTISNVKLGEKVTTVGLSAFEGCTNLYSVEIMGNTTTMGENVFKGCSLLKNVSIHDDATFDIPTQAFYGCTSLKEIYTGKSTQSIGSKAFYGCSNLKTVTIGDGTSSIGTNAFENCTALTDLTVGENVETIDNYAFYGCSSLFKISFGENVKTIGNCAFRNCSSIESIIIPRGVTTIKEYAFSGCSKLKEVHFSPGLTTIEQYAFQNCSSLEEAMLPTTVESIGDRAFSGCAALKNVKIPTSMNSIGNYAFNADNVRSVYTWTIQPTNINQDTFAADAYTKGILYVPATAKKLYFYNTQWSKFIDIRTFDAPYKYFYLTDEDLVIDEDTPRLKGGEDEEFIDGMLVDADLNTGSGLVVEGEESQDLGEVNLDCDGTNSATIIGGSSNIVESGSNVNINDLKININITKNKWYFFCFPFEIRPDMIEFNGQFVWRWYDGDERALNGRGGWKNVVGNLLAGQGYIFQGSVNGTLTLHIGRAHIGAEAKLTTILSHSSENAAHAGWNLIGNPYTSYYDIVDLGFSAPVTVWNGSTYAAYHPDDDMFMLHPYQAFFVQKPEGTENVGFNPLFRYTMNQSNDEIYKDLLHSRYQTRARRANANVKREFLNLELSTDTLIDRTRVVFNNQKSMGYEVGCDAAKFMSDQVAQIYTIDSESNSYAINERPADDYTVRLGFQAPAAGRYTISAARDDVEMEIYDTLTGKSELLSNGYTFTADKGTANDRFILRRAQIITGVEEILDRDADAAIDSDAQYVGIDGVNRGNKAGHGISIERRGNKTRKVINR